MAKKKLGSTTEGGSQGPLDYPPEETAEEPSGGNIESPVSEIQTAAEDYWTVSRMDEAIPVPLPEISEKAFEEEALRLAEEIMATRGGATGQVSLAGEPTAAEEEPTDTEPTATSGGYNYPAPFTRYEVSKICPYNVFPYVTVGKIFFVQNGVSYVGSAASIGNYAIFTAGHCVHQGNGKPEGWSKNLVFVPAYKSGSAPFGQWRATRLWTRTTWYNKGNPNGLCEDMGGGVLLPINNKKISQVVGWLGFAWNWSKYQHWHAVGYPQAAPFDGQKMWDTQASYAYDSGLSCSPKPIGIGCDMTGGCSGGPWIWQFASGNFLNGVNSHRSSSKPQEMFSPYFGDAARSLFNDLIKATP